MRGAVLQIAIAILFTARLAFAIDPSRAVTQYVHRVWTFEQGLPQDSVQAIAQTPDGYLWVGTQEGVVRFDGASFTIFDTQNTPEISSDNITGLYRDRAGRLWVADSRGIAVYRDGRFTKLPGVSEIGSVFGITEDRDGAIWLASLRNGLNRYANGQVTSFGPSDGFHAQSAWAVLADGDTVWIGSSDGLYRRAGGRFERIVSPVLDDENVYALFQDRTGRLWIGSEHGVHTYDGTRVVFFPSLENEQTWAFAEDSHGGIWIATRSGVWRWYQNRLAHIGTEEGLSHPLVNELFIDHEGTLWAGTHLGGLNQFRDGIVVPHTTREGLADATVWSVDGDADTVWAGNEKGVDALRNGRWSSVPALKGKLIYTVTADLEGGVWAGTVDHGLYHVRGSRITVYDQSHGLPVNTVTALLRSRDGGLWVGTLEGLAHLAGGRLESHAGKDLVPYTVTSLHEDRDGRLWVGTNGGGALVRDGGRFSKTFRGIELPRQSVVTVFEDRGGDLWFSTRAGIHRLHDGGLFLYTPKHGLPNALVAHMFEDDQGSLWMTCTAGVFRVRKQQLDDVLRGKAARASVVTYGVRDGLPATEAASQLQPTAWRDGAGRMWMATARGIGVLDPRIDLPPLRTVPIIEKAVVDDKRAEFHYTIPTFIAPERVAFRYRLRGYDESWIEAGNRRVAYYTKLPPGTYAFEVAAASADGRWIAAPSPVRLRIPRPFHRTPWFVALCVAAAMSLIVLLHMLRLRSIRLRHEAVLAERNRIARDFHDTMAQGLTGLSMHLEGAIGSLGEPARATEYLQTAKRLARDSLTEARRALMDLRPVGLEGHDLEDALRKMLALMTEQLPVRGTVLVHGKPRRVADERVERHLLRIAQEAVTNALRHARARNIEILLGYESRRIRLAIRDDGHGSGQFTLDQLAATSHGVRGMRERADEIGARFVIRNNGARGLEVAVEVAA